MSNLTWPVCCSKNMRISLVHTDEARASLVTRVGQYVVHSLCQSAAFNEKSLLIIIIINNNTTCFYVKLHEALNQYVVENVLFFIVCHVISLQGKMEKLIVDL